MERYTLDPEQFSLQLLHELTRSKRLIPSRVALLELIDEHFRTLESIGVLNLKQLISALGNKQKTAALASETGIPVAYLVLLKREAGSYLAKPFPLSDFPTALYMNY